MAGKSNGKKDKVLSIRVNEMMLNGIKSLKNSIFRGEKVNDSEAIRTMIKSYSDGQRELYEKMVSDPMEALANIEDKSAQQGNLFSHAELEFLFNQIYGHLSGNSVTVGTVLVILDFTQDLLKVYPLEEGHEQYMIGNFGFYKKNTIQETLNEYRAVFSERSPIESVSVMDYFARPLHTMLQWHNHSMLSVSELNAAFNPYKNTLIDAAKRSVCQPEKRDGVPKRFFCEKYDYEKIKTLVKNDINLMPVNDHYRNRDPLEERKYSLSGFILTIGHKALVSFSVLELEGLWRNETLEQYVSAQLNPGCYFLELMDSEDTLLVRGPVRVIFTKQEYEDFKLVIKDVFENNADYVEHIKQVYGSI